MEDFFRAKEISFTPVTIDNLDELMAVYQAGKCGSYTADRSRHYAVGLQLANPYDHLILPGVISKEPLEPAVRHGDEQWFNIVRWTLYALIKAEELKVTASSVDDPRAGAKKPAIRRLLGVEGKFGIDMGAGMLTGRDGPSGQPATMRKSLTEISARDPGSALSGINGLRNAGVLLHVLRVR